MGNRGRFGKYGEIKRLDRLRRSRIVTPLPSKDNRRKRFRPRQSLGQALHKEVRVTVRPASDNEFRFIKRLSYKLFNIYGPYEEIISKWFESDMAMTLIALIDGQPVGFAMFGDLFNRYDVQHVVELLAIGVDPIKQGRGVGAFLLKELERKAADLGVKMIFLHTAMNNVHARRLFTRSGYRAVEIKRDFYPKGQDAIVMFKEPSNIC